MKLLLVTQKVDRTDPILGFFHRWLQEFASHAESVTVIGQYVGKYSLPGNVRVVSLGKEDGLPRWRQVLRFWKLQWDLRQQYDVVFVHMTPIWVVLGAKTWWLLRKPVYLWYEVRRGGRVLTLALQVVKKVFSATEHGLPWPSRKQVVVGHGIDTEEFAPGTGERNPQLVVAVGRLTPVKHYDKIVRAFAVLPAECRLTIVGGTIKPSDEAERHRIHDLIHNLGIANRVTIGFLQHEQVRALLQRASLSLHACEGGLDKVVLEAMACGCPVVSTSQAAQAVLPKPLWAEDETFGAVAADTLASDPEELAALAEQLRAEVVTHHSLSQLIARLAEEMSASA